MASEGTGSMGFMDLRALVSSQLNELKDSVNRRLEAFPVLEGDQELARAMTEAVVLAVIERITSFDAAIRDQRQSRDELAAAVDTINVCYPVIPPKTTH